MQPIAEDRLGFSYLGMLDMETAMARNTFRLGVKQSSDYLELFRIAPIVIHPATGGQRRTRPLAVAELGDGDLAFEVFMPAEGDEVPQKFIHIAESVLSKIVEMDDAARAIPSDYDDDECLAYMKIDELGNVDLHYFSSTVNSEWSVRFTPGEDGQWMCRGIVQRNRH